MCHVGGVDGGLEHYSYEHDTTSGLYDVDISALEGVYINFGAL